MLHKCSQGNLPLNAIDNGVRFHSPMVGNQMTWTGSYWYCRYLQSGGRNLNVELLPVFCCGVFCDHTVLSQCKCGFFENAWEKPSLTVMKARITLSSSPSERKSYCNGGKDPCWIALQLVCFISIRESNWNPYNFQLISFRWLVYCVLVFCEWFLIQSSV